MPFGEYVPGRNTVPFIGAIVGDQVPADFTRGKEPVVFRLTTDQVKVAPLICFEDTLGELTRQFVLRGANLLVNVTNDGWFLRSAGARQHLANAIFRCVETRRPMVRAANTGVTCFVNRFGRVTQMLLDGKGSQFTEGVLSGNDRRPDERRDDVSTSRHGELFAKICAALRALVLVRLTDARSRAPDSSRPVATVRIRRAYPHDERLRHLRARFAQILRIVRGGQGHRLRGAARAKSSGCSDRMAPARPRRWKFSKACVRAAAAT